MALGKQDPVIDDHVGGGRKPVGRHNGQHLRASVVHLFGCHRRTRLRQANFREKGVAGGRRHLHRLRRRFGRYAGTGRVLIRRFQAL